MNALEVTVGKHGVRIGTTERRLNGHDRDIERLEANDVQIFQELARITTRVAVYAAIAAFLGSAACSIVIALAVWLVTKGGT